MRQAFALRSVEDLAKSLTDSGVKCLYPEGGLRYATLWLPDLCLNLRVDVLGNVDIYDPHVGTLNYRHPVTKFKVPESGRAWKSEIIQGVLNFVAINQALVEMSTFEAEKPKHIGDSEAEMVFALAAKGDSLTDIAREIGFSVGTVRAVLLGTINNRPVYQRYEHLRLKLLADRDASGLEDDSYITTLRERIKT